MSEFSETLARVRYKDTDQMGMVYYGNYFTFFEVGRVEYIRERVEDNGFLSLFQARART